MVVLPTAADDYTVAEGRAHPHIVGLDAPWTRPRSVGHRVNEEKPFPVPEISDRRSRRTDTGPSRPAPAWVITGLIGLIALGIAGYDAVYTWLERAELRRRGAVARRNHEGRRGR